MGEDGVDGWVIKNVKERRAVDELRARLQDLAGEADETHNLGDACLVRFARARHLKVGAAEKMYRETAAWRKEVDPRGLAESFHPSNLITTFRPGGFLGTDKMGRPVFYDRLGKADPRVLATLSRNAPVGSKASASDQLRDFEIQKQEVLTQVFKMCSEKHGREIYQTFVVQDLRGLGRHHLVPATIDVVRAILGSLDKRYPLRFHKLIIIHPPFIFAMAWNIVKHMVHETTRSQVEVVSGDPSKTLLQYVDADQLPKALGGNLVINGDEYCNPPIVPGGRITKEFKATPSRYEREKSGLPMHLYVPARSSVKISHVDKSKVLNQRLQELPESDVDDVDDEDKEAEAQPNGIGQVFERMISVIGDWVENLVPQQGDEGTKQGGGGGDESLSDSMSDIEALLEAEIASEESEPRKGRYDGSQREHAMLRDRRKGCGPRCVIS